MILAIDTSTPTCKLFVVKDGTTNAYEWEAGRGLADGLIKYLRSILHENGAGWSDISGLIAYKGPGSFTGLRIGLTVFNTIADTNSVPIVGESGDDWLRQGLRRLEQGKNDELVMPLYGREPNITKPRK